MVRRVKIAREERHCLRFGNMARLGKKPIALPQGTTVSVTDGVIAVTGPKGTLSRPAHSLVSIGVSDEGVLVEPKNNSRLSRALWGTFASHIRNMVQGVNEHYVKSLVLEGVGYRVEMKGNDLSFMVGFSHPVLLSVPEGISASVEKNTITISGADKERVGQFAAEVRGVKKPEPYKGKGIRYANEVIRRKQGKKAV